MGIKIDLFNFLFYKVCFNAEIFAPIKASL